MRDGSTNPEQGEPQKTGQTSVGKGGTSAGDTKTYTEKELSDRVAQVGRKRDKEVEALQAKVKASEERAAQLQEQIDSIEEGRFQDNPDALSLHKAKKELRDASAKLQQERDELAREREQFQADVEDGKKLKVLQKAQEIASKYEDGDPQKLAKYTDGSPEQMQDLANDLGWKLKGELEGEVETPEVKLDSGATIGGGKLTVEQADKMPIEEYRERRKKEGAPFR